jgi:hypothetical protein
MRWLLQDGSRQLQLYAPLRFTQLTDAEQFLRRFHSDPAAMQTLREALRNTEEPALLQRLRDDEVIRHVAALLVSGRLHLAAPEQPARWPVFWHKGSGSAEHTEKKPTAKDDSKSQKNDTAKVPIEWKLVYSDGPAVKGFVSLYEPPKGDPEELKPDGQGHHKKDGFWRHDAYAVTLKGTVEVSGKVEDADGKPVKDVLILVEPVYSDSVSLKTDGGGSFKAKGFVEEEEFDVTIQSSGVKITGKFVDSDDKPVHGVSAQLLLDGGQTVSIDTGTDSKFTITERLPDEGFSLCVQKLDPGFAAEGKFVDENGKPVPGVQARLRLDGGGEVTVQSDDAGKFKVSGLFPGEGFSLELLGQ